MPAIIPRPNQIYELVRGLELPLVALAKEHLEVIAEVICGALQDLLVTQPNTLTTGTEPEISALLVSRLNALLNENPLWQQMVRSVSRGSEAISFDGSHLEKRPDLSIHLSGRNPSFPLVVECKIVSSSGKRDVEAYCENGLRRFIAGEYAWPMQEALMLAYVRDESSIANTLTPYLSLSEAISPPPYAIEQMPLDIKLPNVDSALSRHARAFQYLVSPPANQTPGPISIWHLWMATM